jgi:prephenate dehydrogenase
MHFKQLTVVGVGLIGGSFALAARRAGIAERVAGCDTREVLDRAIALGVIDGPDNSFDLGRTSEAGLVYLAAPVGSIVSFLRSRAKLLKPGTLVTDAGSTKREICRAARESLPENVSFVGGHPIAGSEKTGIEFASAELFSGSPYALVMGSDVDSNAADAVREIVSKFGAIPLEMTAEEHDRIVARISHTPQILSTALALAALRAGGARMLAAAGSGFADMTRLARSRWSVWEDVCKTNGDEIVAALDEAISEIESVRAAISSGEFSDLGEMFQSANELMRRFDDEGNKV